jgi:hypothetical protein
MPSLQVLFATLQSDFPTTRLNAAFKIQPLLFCFVVTHKNTKQMKHLSNPKISILLALASQALFGQLMDMRSIVICVIYLCQQQLDVLKLISAKR